MGSVILRDFNPRMRKIKLVSTIFLLSIFYAQAQDANQIIDSLKTELRKNPDAKKAAVIYSDLTWYYSNVSIDSALHYGGKAIQESKKLRDSVLMAQVYSDVGAVYFRKGDYQNSKKQYLTAYKIRKAKKDYNGLAKININLASIYATQQQYESAMKSYLDAISYFESINNEPIVNTTKVNVGYIFRELKNYPKAIKYISEAIAYEEKNNLSNKLCISCLNIGNVYLEMKDTVKALQFYNKSLKACIKAGDKASRASVYNNIGVIKTAQNKSKDALSLFNQSAKVRDELNSDLDKATLQLNVAMELTKAKKYKEAQTLLLQIKKIFEKKNSNENLLLTYNQLVPVYAHLNFPDSVTFYSEKYTLLKEQLLQTLVLKQTNELEAKYQTANKEKRLLQKEVEAKQKNNLLIAISALAFFIALIGLLIYRQQKLKNKQQHQEFQLKSAIAQIEGQSQLQDQRLGISRDLHDNIGAQLTFIISAVENIRYAFDIENIKLDTKLQSISDFARSTIIELRDTIWAMNSEQITFEDLRARILNFIENAKNAREEIAFYFEIDESLKEASLSSVVGMNIYRTIQEAVNNAIKYAEASEITISVKSIDKRIAISIADNGIGFITSEVKKGNGLLNIEKRIEDIGGIFNLVSEDKKGTTISLFINRE